MTKTAFIADIHVGNHQVFPGTYSNGMNDRCRLIVDVLAKAVEIAYRRGCEAMVILGDLFDAVKPPRHPTPQMISAVQDALDYRDGSGRRMKILILKGNHDQLSTMPGDHALAPLNGFGPISVIEESTVHDVGDTRLFLVPHQPGPASLWCPAELGSLADRNPVNKNNIACLHLGIRDGSEEVFLAQSDSSIEGKTLSSVCKELGIQHAIAGDWHFRKRWREQGVELFQCGTLCPTGFNNPGFDGHGTLAIYDCDERAFSVDVVPGPRFVKAVGVDAGLKAMAALSKAQKQGHTTFLRWVVGDEYITQARQDGDDWGHPVEVTSDGLDRKVAARSAAAAARSGKTMDDSLAGYVESMNLDDTVDRKAILERCRRYLT